MMCVPALVGADFAGTWKMTAQSPNGELPFRLVLDKQGESYTGEIRGGSNSFKIDKIAVEGDKIKFTIVHDAGPIPVELTMDGSQLKGEGTLPDGSGKIPMTGAKEAAAVTVAGRWKLAAKAPDGSTVNYALDLKESGGAITGQAFNANGDGAPISGAKLDGAVLSLKVNTPDGDWDVSLTIDGDNAKGSFKAPDGTKGDFTASRSK